MSFEKGEFLLQLKQSMDVVKFSIFHPQWIANRQHKKNLVELASIKNAKILELGCGNSIAYKYVHESCILYRADYPATSTRYRNKPQVMLDAQNLGVASSSVDAVILYEVLEHVPKVSLVVSELNRILKKGGLCYISVPFMYPVHDAPYDFYRFTHYGLIELFDEYGFDLVRFRKYPSGLESLLLLSNLFLLNILKKANTFVGVFSLLLLFFIYPVCFLNNFVAFFSSFFLKRGKDLYLGEFFIVRRG